MPPTSISARGSPIRIAGWRTIFAAIRMSPSGSRRRTTSPLPTWRGSRDGKDGGAHLAFAIQEGGTDWRTIRVLDIESGAILDDEIRWARFTNIAWAKDGSGFFYFPQSRAEGECRIRGAGSRTCRLLPQAWNATVGRQAHSCFGGTVSADPHGRRHCRRTIWRDLLDSPQRWQRARNRGSDEF